MGGAEVRYTLRVVLADGQEVSSATTSVRYMEERPEGHLVNRESGLPFSISDPCVVRGATIPDPAAYRQALQAVKALVGAEVRPSP